MTEPNKTQLNLPKVEEIMEALQFDGELPPLPGDGLKTINGYDAEDMQDYARQSIDNDRAKQVLQKDRIWVECSELAKAIQYPECWDIGAYPELDDALNELVEWAKVSGWTTCKLSKADALAWANSLPDDPDNQNELQLHLTNKSKNENT